MWCEVELAEGLGAEAVGDGAGGLRGGPLDEGLVSKDSLASAASSGSAAPDLDGGVAEAGCGGEFDAGGDAGEQAAAGDGGEDEVDVGELLEDFEAAGGLAGDDVRVVVGRDDGVAVFGGEFFGLELALGAGRADEDDFGAEGARWLRA